jgi:hypothetical protein
MKNSFIRVSCGEDSRRRRWTVNVVRYTVELFPLAPALHTAYHLYAASEKHLPALQVLYPWTERSSVEEKVSPPLR